MHVSRWPKSFKQHSSKGMQISSLNHPDGWARFCLKNGETSWGASRQWQIKTTSLPIHCIGIIDYCSARSERLFKYLVVCIFKSETKWFLRHRWLEDAYADNNVFDSDADTNTRNNKNFLATFLPKMRVVTIWWWSQKQTGVRGGMGRRNN